MRHPRHARASAAFAALLLAQTLPPRIASACATCGCGDPTLTTMGTEAPFEGRLRGSVEVRYREDAIGTEGEDRIELQEGRIDTSISWAPHARFMLGATVPLVHRSVAYVNLASSTTTGLGDAEIRGRYIAYKDRPFGARHLLATTLGLKMPTAPETEDAAGQSAPLELQPGTGSLDPIIGLSYATFQGDWSVFASATGFFATAGYGGDRGSTSLRISTAGQRQLVDWLALRLGVDTRLDAKAIEDGTYEEDSGGFVGFLSPEILLSPGGDVVVVASARVPVLDALVGDHDEGPIVSLAVAKDF